MNLNMVEDHPMSLVLGGVRDNIKREQLWTKYTADYIIANLALLERTANEEFLARAVRSGKFLLQSQNHRFAPKYNDFHETWLDTGWQSFGRAAESLMALGESTTNSDWIERAMAWVDYGIGLQAGDGCFYLINDSYYSSDIAADELRALMRTHWRTGRNRLLKAALHFADWHVEKQYPNGAWPLSIDRWGVTVTEYVGPGDVPNIAISLLLVHMETQDIKYLVSAVKALRYSIGQQAVPNDGGPYGDDPNTHWGYWSWDPRYDYTMSPDQSTHHVRGYWFFLDYFLSLSEETQKAVAEAAGPPDRGLPLLPEEWIASAA
ncbi:MAG: hypothetical protein HY706_04990 [Candidatus Hydrogenedentes bacterium]|nr:hypothetical protein [Candidatus Hydrogenedentota bacterium]